MMTEFSLLPMQYQTNLHCNIHYSINKNNPSPGNEKKYIKIAMDISNRKKCRQTDKFDRQMHLTSDSSGLKPYK